MKVVMRQFVIGLRERSGFSRHAGLLFLLLPSLGLADSATTSYAGQINSSMAGGTGTAGMMWGTGAAGGVGVSGALNSSTTHLLDSQAAGFVQSARSGYLYAPGSTISVQSIGSQTIVSNSIYGNNNTNNMDIRQDSRNDGNTTNDGSINNGGNGSLINR